MPVPVPGEAARTCLGVSSTATSRALFQGGGGHGEDGTGWQGGVGGTGSGLHHWILQCGCHGGPQVCPRNVASTGLRRPSTLTCHGTHRMQFGYCGVYWGPGTQEWVPVGRYMGKKISKRPHGSPCVCHPHPRAHVKTVAGRRVGLKPTELSLEFRWPFQRHDTQTYAGGLRTGVLFQGRLHSGVGM